MKKIFVSEVSVTIEKKPIKHMHLSVYPPDGKKARITAPLHMKDDAIRLFVISKIAWIRKQQAKYSKQERSGLREYMDRESHYLFGKRYLLKVVKTDGKTKITPRSNGILEILVNSNIKKRQVANIMSEWYRKLLKEKVPGLIDKWEKKTDCKVCGWGVKAMRTRWGTCNTRARRIWLNLELAKKPIECLEYIVLHEILHIIERRHNEIFKGLLDKYMPNWKAIKSELIKYPLRQEKWEY